MKSRPMLCPYVWTIAEGSARHEGGGASGWGGSSYPGVGTSGEVGEAPALGAGRALPGVAAVREGCGGMVYADPTHNFRAC